MKNSEAHPVAASILCHVSLKATLEKASTSVIRPYTTNDQKQKHKMNSGRRTFIFGAAGLFSIFLWGRQESSNSIIKKPRTKTHDKIVIKNGWIVRVSQIPGSKTIKS